jgi:tetratricopeptide (TPR) repeat protein
LLSACNNEAEVANYIKQADTYREEGRLVDAISLYNKALDLKEDSKIREKLNETEKEKETIEKTQNALDIFKEVDTYYLQDSDYVSPVKIKEATDKLRDAIDEIEKLDDTKQTDISEFVKNLKESSDYKQVKNYVESNVTDDAETMESLAFLYDDFQVLNEVGASLFNIIGVNISNIANMEIPSKYKEN